MSNSRRDRICLVTSGQPSTTPRLVKEADALDEAGYDVHVLCAYWVDWAYKTDQDLLKSRRWTCSYIGGFPKANDGRYQFSRARHKISNIVLRRWGTAQSIQRWALCRVSPELERAARSFPADLFIAHSLGALAAAIEAARSRRIPVGFDAEDFLLGTNLKGKPRSSIDRAMEAVERRYLPQCDYVTAGSAGIAKAYSQKYGIHMPIEVLNVFPLSERPANRSSASAEAPLSLYWFSQTIGPGRGLEEAVEAISLTGDPTIQLHLRGQWEDGYQDILRAFAACHGVSGDQIVSHPPSAPGAMVQLASEYQVGLALEQPVSDNREICLTNKIFTYLLAGNAIIATATPGQLPIMGSIGDAGFCYRQGDVTGFAKQLTRWAKNRRSLGRAKQRSWDWGTSRYNWDLEKHRFLDIIRKTLSPVRQAPC